MPCPINTPAVTPDSATREALVDICGDSWANTDVCCTIDQITNLKKNLKKAENIISSCPACKDNFFQFFCRFTCSPDQSTFVNITAIGQSSSKKDVVTELDHFVDPTFAAGFYDSCKDVKFSATNGRAMDLIGGGAQNYTQFLKFLGDEKPLLGGSPFQMNFPWDEENRPKEIIPSTGVVRQCNDKDPKYRCACPDCPESCPTLPKLAQSHHCKVGAIPCFSFAVLIIYAGVLTLIVFAYSLYVAWKSKVLNRHDTMRLLHDAPESEDDEDEEFFMQRRGFRNTVFSFFKDESVFLGQYNINTKLQEWFSRTAFVFASFPGTVISVCLLAVFLLSLGMFRFSLELNPVKLWVSSSSAEYQEKLFYDDNFGPFYRSEQAYLVNDTGPVLSYDTLEWWFDVESRASQLTTSEGVKFSDVCYGPFEGTCVLQSVTQYFGGDFEQVPEASWSRKIQSCAASPVTCLPPFNQPLNKEMIFGGYKGNDVLLSQALVVTWVVNNGDKDSEVVTRAESWETELEKFLLQVQVEAEERGLRLSFSTDISLEKELNKSTNTDARIVALSYLFMFIYASVALGGVLPGFGKNSFVKSKFSLGLFGIFVVLLSVAASVGFFSFLGVKATLIIAEVIPFLVLAVGVDNIFLITHELETVNSSHPNESVEERVSRAVGHIGPSILLSAFCETLTFALGATVSMPAVRNFALYSAGAVFVNFILQLTMFVSAITLDQKRIESNRFDLIPCLRSRKSKGLSQESFSSITARALASPGVFEKVNEPTFSKLIKRHYAPYILKANIKPVIMTIFFAFFAIGLSLFPKLELGLDQRIAVPSDSYLVNYFDDFYSFFNVGPPIYFVTSDANFTSREVQQALCGRFTTCHELSLVNIVEQEGKRSNISYIKNTPASWIDDFFTWLNPDLDECCLVRKKSDTLEFCPPGSNPRLCETCYAKHKPAWNVDMSGMPEGEEFMTYFNAWIEAPSDPCPLGGKAPYSAEVSVEYGNSAIQASKFRSMHVPLRSQDDFINAYLSARRIAKSIEEASGINTFAYSPFYIFFAQYVTIIRDSIVLISCALAAIFLVASFLLGSFQTSLVLVITVIMIITDIVGIMALWGVNLNAVSLVNLVICVGIGVEFCVHIARAFTFVQKVQAPGNLCITRQSRAFNALVNVGGSVFGGIALTKFIGVSVLAFTHSKIFEIYYFRMWLSLVLVATTHALIFLPVFLTYFGGRGYILDNHDEGLVGDLASRLDSNENTFLTDDDDDEE